LSDFANVLKDKLLNILILCYSVFIKIMIKIDFTLSEWLYVLYMEKCFAVVAIFFPTTTCFVA